MVIQDPEAQAAQEATPAPAAAQRVIPTLASLSPGQVAAIRRLRPIEQTPMPTDEARRPARHFVDPAHFERERQAILQRRPLPVALSVQLPEPNQLLALESYGKPLLLTRNAKGEPKVFLNVCRHKGSKLVERTDVFKGGRVSCPYHGWTFGVDGRLVGVPRQEAFPTLRKEDHGLVELPSREAGGVIWAHLDPGATPDFGSIPDELVADLDGFRLGSLHLYGQKTFELPANWKLVIEPFLEPYHIQRLHASSVAGMFADVPNLTETLGDHLRQVSGRVNFTPALLDTQRDENIHKIVTHAYILFPGTVLITSPYYISVMIIQPRAVNHSTVQYFMLTREAPDNDKAEELFARSYEMILSVFGTEDFRAACLSQAGLEAGGLQELLYGGMEVNIPLFYGIVERHLER
jgi:nitrite reductase/ring-hydroxylating ferredoxin subunit